MICPSISSSFGNLSGMTHACLRTDDERQIRQIPHANLEPLSHARTSCPHRSMIFVLLSVTVVDVVVDVVFSQVQRRSEERAAS